MLMTRKQQVLECICKDYNGTNLLFGMLDIYEKTLISKNTVRSVLGRLRDSGMIERDENEPALPRIYHWYKLTTKGKKQCRNLEKNP